MYIYNKNNARSMSLADKTIPTSLLSKEEAGKAHKN